MGINERYVNLDSSPLGTTGIVINKGTILTGFLHLRHPNKASGWFRNIYFVDILTDFTSLLASLTPAAFVPFTR